MSMATVYFIDTHITLPEMISLRKMAKLNQEQMATAMGLSKSAYVAIENERAEFRTIHSLAAERVLLAEAARTGNTHIVPKSVQGDLSNLVVLTAEEHKALGKAFRDNP